MSERPDGPVNLGRHRRNCKICAHQHRDEIEREFINWTGVKAIAKEFGLADRTAVYRHSRVLLPTIDHPTFSVSDYNLL